MKENILEVNKSKVLSGESRHWAAILAKSQKNPRRTSTGINGAWPNLFNVTGKNTYKSVLFNMIVEQLDRAVLFPVRLWQRPYGIFGIFTNTDPPIQGDRSGPSLQHRRSLAKMCMWPMRERGLAEFYNFYEECSKDQLQALALLSTQHPFGIMCRVINIHTAYFRCTQTLTTAS